MKYCFSCLKSRRSKKTNRNHAESAICSNGSKAPGLTLFTLWCADTKKQKVTHVNKEKEIIELYRRQINAQSFTFRELATATKNFRKECLLGEGRFGRVYKGTLKSTGQVVAVKQLDRNSVQGKKEFLEEVLRLSLLHHPNLVNLIGYCADGDQRLLVYEYMRGGTVEDGLTDLTEDKKPLDWATRIKIALGAARGLEFLHVEAKPPVIYHDLQAANILLDENFKPKLSIFGLAKLGPVGDDNQFSTRVIETYGYTAPEYAETCQVTMKSDVYSFGVILLELITGRRVIDNTRPAEEQNLISWAEPIFKDPKRFPDMVDPHLKRRIPERSLNQAVAVAAMCLQDEPSTRPLMSDVVTILSFLNGNEQGNFVQDSKHWANHEDKEISKRESSDCPGISEGSKGKSLISSRENSKRGSKSPKNSDNRSVDKSFSSRSFATNKKLQDGNAPSYTESRWKSNGVSVNSCQNGSKKLQKSSNLKRIRKYYWLSKKQTKKTFSLTKQMSTRIWRYWFKSKKHEKLKDKTFSSRHKKVRKSHKILDDTATSTRSRMSKDALCEVTLLHP